MKNMIKIVSIIGLCSCLAGCLLKPYVADVQQGNVITQQQMDSLRLGMSKSKVKAIMGGSVLKNIFSRDYWTYVHTMQINGGPIMVRYLTQYFKGDILVRIK